MSTPTTNSVSSQTVTLSTDPDINGLIYGIHWGTGSGVNLTYSFPTPTSSWSPSYSTADEPNTTGVIALTGSERAYASMALDSWSHYANITFTQVADTASTVGDIRISMSALGENSDQLAHAYAPAPQPRGGDVWFNNDLATDGLQPGSYDYMALLHEIGHALGLKHPFDLDVPRNPVALSADLDSINYTVMSYQAYPGYSNGDYALSYYPTTPMSLDIQAIEFLYGRNPTFSAGNTTYTFDQGKDYFQTIYDNGGTDTIVWNATTEGADISLSAGDWSDLGNDIFMVDSTGEVVSDDPFNVNIYFGSVIENATGGGADDQIYGNAANNVLKGMAGHDNLYGYEGSDTLEGGEGNDHIYGYAASGGTDGADSLSGGGGSDYIQGNAGNDMLDGGTGSDRINGGGNDDAIAGGADNDTINGNLGNDAITGDAGNDSLRGGQGNDTLSAGDGNDILAGDLGVDVLTGGAGADLFVFSGSGSPVASPDRITDFADGIDHISVGFAPIILNAGNQGDAAAALTAAQHAFDAQAGDGELALVQVGRDAYLFYASSGGATVDAAVMLVGINTSAIGLADFA